MEQGTTLVELLVTILVNAILIGSILGTSVAIMHAMKTTNQISSCTADMNRVVDALAKDCQNAIRLVAWSSQGLSLVLGHKGDTLTYSFSQGTLYRDKQPFKMVWGGAALSCIHYPLEQWGGE
jgi:hypothetical protein